MIRARGWLVAVALTAVATSVVLAGQTSETERSREVVRHWFELINKGDWQGAAELFAPDVQHRSGNWKSGAELIVHGRKGLLGNLEDIYRTFPDWKMEIVDMVADGETVVVRLPGQRDT